MSRLLLKTKLTAKYFRNKFTKQPLHAGIEVTKRCNAHCKFCDYWKTEKEEPLSDYSEIVARLGVMYVSITGGEPLLRKDLEEVIKKIKQKNSVYIGLITNGWLLTVERAKKLLAAGVDQLAVSLDFPDNRHDDFRGLPGLFARISKIMPEIGKLGFDNVILNTVIMRDNLDDIVNIAELARSWGIKVSYSAYDSGKSSNGHLWIDSQHQKKLENIIEEVLKQKSLYGNVRSSDYYLKQIPRYFSKNEIGGCQAGRKWVQVTPEGKLKPCSELEIVCDHSEYKRSLFKKVDCQRCWYNCRGEAQAPLDMKRYREFF